MNATSTVAPQAHPTNPALFLAQLADNGGGYCLTPDGQLYLGIVHTGASANDLGLALGMIAGLTASDLDAIKQHVAGLKAESAPSSWTESMQRVEVSQRACESCEGYPFDIPDDVMDAYTDAVFAAMAAPAPNGSALLWKLERLLGENDDKDGFTPSWSYDHIAQTLADMRRILGGDDNALVAAWEEVRDLTRTLNAPDQALPNEDELQQRLDRAERFIIDTPAQTTAGVLAKLQLAVLHGCDDRADNDALTAGHYDRLQKASARWDFDRIATFSALQSLRVMEG